MRLALALSLALISCKATDDTDVPADTDADADADADSDADSDADTDTDLSCDFTDLEGEWTGVAGGAPQELRFLRSASLGSLIGTNALLIPPEAGVESCYFDMECGATTAQGLRTVFNALSTPNPVCVEGWYTLELLGPDTLEIQFFQNLGSNPQPAYTVDRIIP